MDEKRLYNIWRCMVGRCHNENWNNYYTKTYYRDKGISVCDEWRYDFDEFKTWAIVNGYEDGLSIDRIDADGNYEPSNCRWITYEENRMRGLENARKSYMQRCSDKRYKPNKPKGRYEVRDDFHFSFGRIVKNGLSYHDAKVFANTMDSENRKKNIPAWQSSFTIYKSEKGSKVGDLVFYR